MGYRFCGLLHFNDFCVRLFYQHKTKCVDEKDTQQKCRTKVRFMTENLDTARFSAIFISAIEMGHENTKNLKSIYKTEDFRNLNPYMPTS